MAIINLRDYYPFYTSDYFMEVPEDVVEMFKEFDRKEAAYRLRTYRHKAYYSLDRNDGIEHEALFVAFSPYELYERKVTIQELYTAISRLPDKQAKRIYAHFILGLTKQDIARAEGVDEKVVRLAIERGLRNLEKILKKIFIRCTDFASKMKWLMRGSQSLGPHWPEAGHASRRLKTE
ncbi:sigma-70 family RNA polymerase sigma factor [Lachnospiraceae bacterium OF11-28]|nr:sigma-70 family RNA polymerase sigma factor [Lachnospiraceae bacterium OF11-28]